MQPEILIAIDESTGEMYITTTDGVEYYATYAGMRDVPVLEAV